MLVDIKVFNDIVSGEIIPELERFSVNLLKQMTVTLVDDLNTIKWKDTGRFIASLNVSIDTPDYTIRPKSDSYKDQDSSNVLAALSSLKVGDSPTLTYPLPYSRRLEVAGWSKKDAPFSIKARVERVASTFRFDQNAS